MQFLLLFFHHFFYNVCSNGGYFFVMREISTKAPSSPLRRGWLVKKTRQRYASMIHAISWHFVNCAKNMFLTYFKGPLRPQKYKIYITVSVLWRHFWFFFLLWYYFTEKYNAILVWAWTFAVHTIVSHTFKRTTKSCTFENCDNSCCLRLPKSFIEKC